LPVDLTDGGAQLILCLRRRRDEWSNQRKDRCQGTGGRSQWGFAPFIGSEWLSALYGRPRALPMRPPAALCDESCQRSRNFTEDSAADSVVFPSPLWGGARGGVLIC